MSFWNQNLNPWRFLQHEMYKTLYWIFLPFSLNRRKREFVVDIDVVIAMHKINLIFSIIASLFALIVKADWWYSIYQHPFIPNKEGTCFKRPRMLSNWTLLRVINVDLRATHLAKKHCCSNFRYRILNMYEALDGLFVFSCD